MAADSVEVTAASTTLGEITSRGRLLDWQGNAVAGFRQQYRLWRGSRVLQLDMELDPHSAPGPDPWHSYYACRFAWASEAADLWRAVHHGRQPAGGKQLESPLYLEIDDAQTRTSILTGGLPFHRRQGRRMLDCLLIVRGERARTFRVGIGVDLRNPIREAISFLAPPVLVRQTLPTPTPSASGWLFHLDARNVVATYWGPLVCEGRVEGFRVRLLETAGRSARLKLTCFRAVSSASQVDFRGRSLGQCRVDNGAICLDFSAHQWMELEARW
jgi:alpha-mannosidase